ncbi:hypothetical protein FALBO_11906 [Fusarium albosuccineum]|uniref:Uncharacterized protein n=1 Tax=Fusarium albosuccineum TaxID=1237068 RepID=A0A8H4L502_9HYPO|nr:hypothetical protein FALBO_11906 [Fusarium albosuccineum]
MLPNIVTICNTTRNISNRATTLKPQMAAVPARMGAIEFTIYERAYRALPDMPESDLDKDDDIKDSDKDDIETDGLKTEPEGSVL